MIEIFDFEYEKNYNRIDVWFYSYGLKNAATIIAQSDYQKKLLKKKDGFNALIIESICNLIHRIKDKDSAKCYVLRIGSFNKAKKQPHLFLKLAREIPDKRFLLIGKKRKDETHYNKLIGNDKVSKT